MGHRKLSNSFTPLVYLFCKEGESDGACHLLTHALVATGKKYFDVKLTPGSGSTDHAPALRKCMVDEWPDIEFGQCYPHLIRKYGEGQFFKGTSTNKTWDKFEKGREMIQDIHLCGTPPMKGLVTREVGKIWDVWGHQMDKFWDSNCTPPWDCWSICDMTTMLSTPSNQVQETWHKQLMQSIIPGLFKGSTTTVISETLPKIIRMDGTRIPDVLGFDVSAVLSSPPRPWPFPRDSPSRSSGVQVPAIPTGILKKAKWYVDHQATHIHIARDGKGGFIWYVLRKDNPGGWKKVLNKTLQAYIDACNGKKAPMIKTYADLANVCQGYHHLVVAEKRVPGCDMNKAKLDCPTCKGFKLYGICSHVVAINTILGKADVDDALAELCQPRKQGGYRHGVRPALMKEKEAESDSSPPPESDSSDDEPLSKRAELRAALKGPKSKGLKGLQLP